MVVFCCELRIEELLQSARFLLGVENGLDDVALGRLERLDGCEILRAPRSVTPEQKRVRRERESTSAPFARSQLAWPMTTLMSPSSTPASASSASASVAFSLPSATEPSVAAASPPS